MVVCLPPYFNRIVVVYLAQIIENRVVKYYWIRAIVSEIRSNEHWAGSAREIYLAHSKCYSSSLSNCLVIISKMTETKIKTTDNAIATPRLRSKPI